MLLTALKNRKIETSFQNRDPHKILSRLVGLAARVALKKKKKDLLDWWQSNQQSFTYENSTNENLKIKINFLRIQEKLKKDCSSIILQTEYLENFPK